MSPSFQTGDLASSGREPAEGGTRAQLLELLGSFATLYPEKLDRCRTRFGHHAQHDLRGFVTSLGSYSSEAVPSKAVGVSVGVRPGPNIVLSRDAVSKKQPEELRTVGLSIHLRTRSTKADSSQREAGGLKVCRELRGSVAKHFVREDTSSEVCGPPS